MAKEKEKNVPEQTADTANSISNSLEPMREVIDKIVKVVDECSPIIKQNIAKNNAISSSIRETLILAKGIEILRNIFRTNEAVKATILNLADSPLGFLTDRAKKKKSEEKYQYNELADCCLEAALHGYRWYGNEFNIISHKFYPAKDGKYRHIVETPRLHNFEFGNSAPKQITKEYSSVSCWATWSIGDKQYDIGVKEGDFLTFSIRTWDDTGMDAIVGKALSKLFSRVLYRIDGTLLPEATDIMPEEIIDEPVTKAIYLQKAITERQIPVEKSSVKGSLNEKLEELGTDSETFCKFFHIESIETSSDEAIKSLLVNEWSRFANNVLDMQLAKDEKR